MKLCGFEAGIDQPFFLIAGPCVAESEQLCLDVAGQMKEICAQLSIPYIFKASYDKANRSSGKSFRGHGMSEGLANPRSGEAPDRCAGIDRRKYTMRAEVPEVAAVVDVLQTPAFLCRQTDFIHAVAASGKPVNIKKGQFLAPGDMKNVADKGARGQRWRRDTIMVCERGASFGYNNLVGHALAGHHARDRLSGGSMPPIRCSCRAGGAPPRVVSASSCRCCRGRWRWASQASSWRPPRPREGAVRRPQRLARCRR